MRFYYPYFLLLIPAILAAVYYTRKKNLVKSSGILFSDVKVLSAQRGVPYGKKITDALKLAAVLLAVVALARPQGGEKTSEITKKGIDIMLCLDTSSSMRAEDFTPLNRLGVAKQTVKNFVKGRKNDRIGVVVFSAVAFTQCPLTTDYGSLLDFLDKVDIGVTQTDGTAIGTAIMTCVKRLKDSQAKSKIIILLTDGRNNMGEVDPITAAKAAATFGIKVYTIGAAGKGPAPYPIDDPIFGRRYVQIQEDLDEGMLAQIADETGGLYFRATDRASLEQIYKKIDSMEKTDFKIEEYTDFRELYGWFLFPSVIFLLLGILLENFKFRTVP